MNSLSDPRRPKYFTTFNNGVYVGGIYGASNPFITISLILHLQITEPTFPGVSAYL